MFKLPTERKGKRKRETRNGKQIESNKMEVYVGVEGRWDGPL